MALTALAVVNRRGVPLYLRDYAADANLIFNFHGNCGDDIDSLFDDDDCDGKMVGGPTPQQMESWPCQTRYQFILHSAVQRLEGVLAGGGSWKAPGATGMNACWVGLLCISDNFRAYGYATTNAKYVVLVENSIAPDNTQVQAERDNEICAFMSDVHRLYTESLMNPFTTPHSKITSKRFDAGVTSLVQSLNGN